jgi:uncharacterized protein
MKTGILMMVLGAISVLLPACSVERRVLYHPGQATLGEIKQYAADNDLQMWPAQDETYRGIVSRKGPGGFKGTIVVFHGNGGAAASRAFYVTALQSRGYRVVLAEYPGYGGRPGELSEKSFVTDARSTALSALEGFGGPLFLWGESMGCGVASALATDPDLHPGGVVMLTPWNSLHEEGKAKFPWLPFRFLLHDTYDNAENLSAYGGAVAVIMSRRDEVIPNRLTEQLYASLSEPKRLWIFGTAGHSDWPHSPELPWWDEVLDFLDSKR